jgi:hypothetical protein
MSSEVPLVDLPRRNSRGLTNVSYLPRKKNIKMADLIDESSGMAIVNIATPSRQPLWGGLAKNHTKDFI